MEALTAAQQTAAAVLALRAGTMKQQLIFDGNGSVEGQQDRDPEEESKKVRSEERRVGKEC